MLYEMAKRYDQWAGEEYEGSSARGAMKGWHKHGVCSEELWGYDPDEAGFLTRKAQEDAVRYTLGAYYRIQKRRSDLHAALNEVGVVFTTAATHRGWDEVENGVIPFDPEWDEQGGHAFALVGYTEDGFLIQNSWGPDWGGVKIGRTTHAGCVIWTYPDFDRSLWDAWVARLALPVESVTALSAQATRYAVRPGGVEVVERAPPRPTIRQHFVHIDDGHFDRWGDYYSSADEVREIITDAVTGSPSHILLYAHGGLNSVKASASRVAKWRPVFEANGIHEIHFIWETGLFEELRDVLLGKQDSVSRRAAGPSDWWDAVVERLTHIPGHALWMEMLSDAELAFQSDRAGASVLQMLCEALRTSERKPQLHLVGHSAGSVWFGELLRSWQDVGGPPIENLVLFAPACTHGFFASHIKPALQNQLVNALHHFLLDDKTERADNVAQIYRKSLLYLVSRSYQKKGQVVPIMGMAKYLDKLETDGVEDRVHPHSTDQEPRWTASTSHGGFDNDPQTMNAMLALVVGENNVRRPFEPVDLEGY
jgi:hypothetical protein